MFNYIQVVSAGYILLTSVCPMSNDLDVFVIICFFTVVAVEP